MNKHCWTFLFEKWNKGKDVDSLRFIGLIICLSVWICDMLDVIDLVTSEWRHIRVNDPTLSYAAWVRGLKTIENDSTVAIGIIMDIFK